MGLWGVTWHGVVLGKNPDGDSMPLVERLVVAALTLFVLLPGTVSLALPIYFACKQRKVMTEKFPADAGDGDVLAVFPHLGEQFEKVALHRAFVLERDRRRWADSPHLEYRSRGCGHGQRRKRLDINGLH